LSYINHPFIVRLRFAFQDADKVFLILDYCPGGNLTACINRYQSLPEDIARIYMCEILLAISELHRRGIIYRDLKPDNVILDIDGHSLLTDFGLSKEGVLDNVSAMSFCGSIAYLAPEMIRRQGHGKAVDWYLFGVILYEMLTGKPPYYNGDRKILLYNIENAKLKIPPRLSDEAKNILKRLLKRDPHKRLGSVDDSEEVKQHPFFAGINWTDVYNKKLKPPTPPPSLIKAGFLSGYKLGSDEHSNADTKLNGWTFVSE
jgi:serine/threonine protein kinase